MATGMCSARKDSKRMSRRAWAGMLGWALIIALGSSGCKKSKAPTAPPAGKTEVKAVLHLEPFVVNLADSEDNCFLRIGLDLGLTNELSAKEAKGPEGNVPMARIRDCILSVVSAWTSDALLAPDGKQKLKDQLVKSLRARVPELGVQEIYFTDFLMQR